MQNIYYFKKFKKTRKIALNEQDLKNFERKIAKDYEKAKIKGPIHLTEGNEKKLIEIFSIIKKTDWVFSSWRNHYHALLHGVNKKQITDFVYSGKSMSVSSKNPKFFASSIVGGVISIAMGTALALKKKNLNKKFFVL